MFHRDQALKISFIFWQSVYVKREGKNLEQINLLKLNNAATTFATFQRCVEKYIFKYSSHYLWLLMLH